MLATEERPAVIVSTVLLHHLAAAVGAVTAASATLFAVIETTTTQTWGISGVVALSFSLVGIVFRTQQNQLRAQRVEMARMGRRIEHLEAELDMRRA